MVPGITVTKAVTSGPTSVGDGQFRLHYTVTVTNTGAGAGIYDLADQLAFGDGITIDEQSVVNTTARGRRPTPLGRRSQR